MRDRLHKAMEERGWPVTFSIGVLSCPTPPATTDEMVREADRVTYSVRRDGKNAILYESYDGAL